MARPQRCHTNDAGLIGTAEAETDTALALIRDAVDAERAAGEPRPGTALLALGAALARDGQFAAAADLLWESWRERSRTVWSDAVMLQLAGLLALCLTELDRGDELSRLLRDADPLVNRAEAEWGAAALPLAMLLHVAEARARYRAGEPGEARDLLVRAVRAGAPVRASTHVVALLSLADAELACGDRAAARAALRTARDVADEEPVPLQVIGQLERAEARMGRGAARAAARAGVLVEDLTDRELAVLRALAGTATRREIGVELYLSVNTVRPTPAASTASSASARDTMQSPWPASSV